MYCLIQDNDNHWYVCKSEDYEKLSQYFDKLDNYWNDRYFGDGNVDVNEPTCNIKYHSVGGSPSLVKFENWKIE